MPQNEAILITGAAGFIGQVLAAALLESSPNITLTLTDVIEPPVPSSVSQHLNRVTATSSDLTQPSAVASLLSGSFKAVYLLHGLMSGGAEANLELGWRVNWDSHRAILDQLRIHHPGTVVVFPSSLAVYGPTASGDVTNESTNPLPQSSYGAQKLMVETYLNDFSRRGLLDGRVVRLPTVVVRPGAPSAAASSFASGIIREPLQGKKSVLPVSRDLEMWVCSPKTVVANLIRVKDVPKEKFGLSRVLNLPGITVTVQQMLDAVEKVGGNQAVGLIEESRDPKVEAIVGSWPARFNTSRAQGLGLVADRTLVETVNEYAESLR
ncbi:nad-dependent epimerase dehydratase protein [Diaporthe amygdali]|uniref:nad-dependent epimerase dehydratase protein n=1 Tax=Phomopsis amygdali TaxID=1214568 RepID=UPI0022FDF87A|nr:nad-dependent epimerase dehydratase protein [Diaporthe amygdali]KAJ0123745.1 nad-dependent epimerase dehydratase protein [Diaporthe amygdali]